MDAAEVKRAVEVLERGGVVVMPTDTVYGMVASARMPDVVERVYQVRGREAGKPCIVLIAEKSDIHAFGIILTETETRYMERYWPGAVSMVLPCREARFSYLHRGTGTIAFRVPDTERLREMLRKTGPLIAPSANPAGLPTATTSAEAQQYFHDQVDYYVDGGKVEGEASTVIRFDTEGVTLLRAGKVQIV